MEDSGAVVPHVLFELLIRLSVGEVAEGPDDIAVPGLGSDEASDSLEGLNHSEKIKLCGHEVGVDKGLAEWIARRRLDESTLKDFLLVNRRTISWVWSLRDVGEIRAVVTLMKLPGGPGVPGTAHTF